MEVFQIQRNAKALEARKTKDIGAKEWKKIFETQKASGKSIKSCCKENGISPSAYYRRQKEAAGTARQKKGSKPAAGNKEFLVT